MNYFDYINGLKPNDNLKNDIKAKVNLEISKQKIKKNNIKKVYISIAACFVLLIATIMTAKTLTHNSIYIDDSTEISETEPNPSKNILIRIASDKTNEPQCILIGDNLYLQYISGDSNKKADNDRIEINKSDIGELLYTINENNLVSNLKSSNNSDTNDTDPNKFYNAEVYRLNNYENNTVVLVKEENKEEYYLFYLINE